MKFFFFVVRSNFYVQLLSEYRLCLLKYDSLSAFAFEMLALVFPSSFVQIRH